MSNKQNITAFMKQLQSLIESPTESLEKAVALEAYDPQSDENTIRFFKDLLNHGCICGMVSSLVYYRDTEAFFDKYYEEIIWLKSEYEESIGQFIDLGYNWKNTLAWFAFEETARKLWEAH